MLSVSLFWSLACVNALYAVMTHGASMVLQHQFDAAEALRLIEAERCTVFYGTPNMALALWEHPQRAAHDLSSLRTGVTIGTPEQVRAETNPLIQEFIQARLKFPQTQPTS